MQIKVIELSGAQLNWAVAHVQELTTSTLDLLYDIKSFADYHASTDWSVGGPILDEAGISILRCDDDYGVDDQGYCNNVRIPVWCATNGQHSTTSSTEHQQHDEMFQIYGHDVVYGKTALEAAMRCFVLIKLSKSQWNLYLNTVIDVPDDIN